MPQRYLAQPLVHHLNTLRQMVFLVGPRQVGKTTLAQSFLSKVEPGRNYFNWDVAEHRRILTTRLLPGKEPIPVGERLVFDEIHKYPRWKNALKGLFDLHTPETHWIVTGSAMLNVFRRGQDSLLGRHFTYHLAPFSVAELLGDTRDAVPKLEELILHAMDAQEASAHDALMTLSRWSGFPEPLFTGTEDFLLRWRTNRLERLVNQDLAATEVLRHLPLVEQLMFLLPERVGSPLSHNSLREELEVHFATVKHWMELLERSFYGFFIRPYAKHAARMLKKEAKWYLWDWTELQDPGARFENLVAVHLRKYVDYMNDLGLDQLSLHYVRDKQKREVDFLICRARKPLLLVECKVSERHPDPSLAYFARALRVPHAIHLVAESGAVRIADVDGTKIHIMPAARLLRQLV